MLEKLRHHDEECRAALSREAKVQETLRHRDEEYQAALSREAKVQETLRHRDEEHQAALSREAKVQERVRHHDEEYQAVLSAASQNEVLQRELAVLRRLVVGTLEFTRATSEEDLLLAYSIDSPEPGSSTTEEEIEVHGWVLGRTSPVVAVELIFPDGVFKRVSVEIERPDIAATNPQIPWAKTSGFRAIVSALEMARASQVELRAVLSDTSSILLGLIRAIPRDRVEAQQDSKRLAAAEAKISELCQGLEEASAREAEWRQKLLRQDQEYQDALTKVSQIESLRRELDTLRQVAIGTLQVSLSTQDGGSLLEGFSIDAPDSRNQVRADELELNGWIVGRTCPAVAVELIGAAGTLKRVPVQIQRPDIAAEHPQVPWAETSGFRTTISALEMAQATRVELRDPTGWQQCPPWDDSCRLRG